MLLKPVMNRIHRNALIIFTLFFGLSAFATPPRPKLVTRIVNAEYTLEEVMKRPETAIPASILQDAKGIILVINYKAGFMVGGHTGRGVIVTKNPMTGQWSVPAFVKTGGANLGLQLGAKELDTIYVIMDDDTVRKACTGRFDLSAEAAAVAGPKAAVSEVTEGKDYKNAKILVYSTAKGLFAGVSVKAGWVAPDNKSTKSFYNTDYSIPEIVMSDWYQMPDEAKNLILRLNYHTGSSN